MKIRENSLKNVYIRIFINDYKPASLGRNDSNPRNIIKKWDLDENDLLKAKYVINLFDIILLQEDFDYTSIQFEWFNKLSLINIKKTLNNHLPFILPHTSSTNNNVSINNLSIQKRKTHDTIHNTTWNYLRKINDLDYKWYHYTTKLVYDRINHKKNKK